MTFADLQLVEPILRAVATEGYNNATPIQAQTRGRTHGHRASVVVHHKGERAARSAISQWV